MLKDVYRDLVSEVSALGSVVVYVVVTLVFLVQGYSQVFDRLAAALILGYAVATLFRMAFFKQRPKKRAFKTFIEKIDAGSFPSLHAMRATFGSVILGAFFQNILVCSLLVLCVIGVSYARMREKRHYLADVLVGIALGLVIGFGTLYFI